MSQQDVVLSEDGRRAELCVDAGAKGMVLFAQGGSGRSSARDRLVARCLHGRGLGTLMCDLLLPREAMDHDQPFDVPLLARRLSSAMDWLQAQPALRALPLGLFGSGAIAAAVLAVAADRPRDVAALVARAGRLDLAWSALPKLRAPTLLIVGGDDAEVLALNRRASRLLAGRKEIAVIEGASHRLEEPGAQEQVASLAADWLASHLTGQLEATPKGQTGPRMERAGPAAERAQRALRPQR